MFVDYSSLNQFAKINLTFADKYLELLFLEELSDSEDKLLYLKGRNPNISSIQNLELEDIANNSNWAEYILGLCLSREQMDECMDELLECPTLYMVEFAINSCSIMIANQLGPSNRIKHAVFDAYASYIFIRCKINTHLKEEIVARTPSPYMQFSEFDHVQKLLYGEYLTAQTGIVKARTDIIIIPRTFPTSFGNVIDHSGFVSSKIKLRFYKWSVLGTVYELESIQFSELKPLLIKHKITTIWKKGAPETLFNSYSQFLQNAMKKNGADSETTIVLKGIQERVNKRQARIKDFGVFLTPENTVSGNGLEPEFMKIFESIGNPIREEPYSRNFLENERTISTYISRSDASQEFCTDPSRAPAKMFQNNFRSSVHGSFRTSQTAFECDHCIAKNEQLNEGNPLVREVPPPTRTQSLSTRRSPETNCIKISRKPTYTSSIGLTTGKGGFDLDHNIDLNVFKYPQSAYLPRQNDDEEPDIILKSGLDAKNSAMTKTRVSVVSPQERTQIQSAKSGNALNYDAMYPALSRVSFGNFFKFKFKKLKQDCHYYSEVAKYCLNDIHEKPHVVK